MFCKSRKTPPPHLQRRSPTKCVSSTPLAPRTVIFPFFFFITAFYSLITLHLASLFFGLLFWLVFLQLFVTHTYTHTLIYGMYIVIVDIFLCFAFRSVTLRAVHLHIRIHIHIVLRIEMRTHGFFRSIFFVLLIKMNISQFFRFLSHMFAFS